jgi:uncharacterized RDD family membrane protein YckC
MEILDTPGTTSIQIKYAGFWIRFVAWLIDAILTSIVNYALMFLFFADMFKNVAEGGNPAESMNFGLMGFFYVLVLVINWLYFALMESSANQGSLGKMALGIIVTDMQGNRISFARATGRYFAKILSGIILLIGYIMAGLTQKKQGLHDMIVNTLVIRKPGY